jgi:hypothetical protein
LLTFKEADDGWVFDVSLSEQETRISWFILFCKR